MCLQLPNRKVEKTNTIEGWTPDDYKMAAGRSQNSKVPNAMDFMSRLDTNVKVLLCKYIYIRILVISVRSRKILMLIKLCHSL